MLGLLAVQVQALAAPPVGTRPSRPPRTPNPHLQKRLPLQRLAPWKRAGHLDATLLLPNWCSSFRRSTAVLQQQLLRSIPMHTPSQQRSPAALRELSQVSVSSLSICAFTINIPSSNFWWLAGLFFIPDRDRRNGPALQGLWWHCIWFPLWSACLWGLQGEALTTKML